MFPIANLAARIPGVVALLLRNNPNYSGFQVAAAGTVDAAYATPTALFQVPMGATYRSKTIRRAGTYQVPSSLVGQTEAAWHPDDFASTTVPGDSLLSFSRVAGINPAGSVGGYGPILVVPPPGFFGAGRAAMTLSGTAPNLAALPSLTAPQNAMWLEFPKFLRNVTVYNDGDGSLFVSLGSGLQEMEVPTETSVSFSEVGSALLSFRGAAATQAFRLQVSLVNGLIG